MTTAHRAAEEHAAPPPADDRAYCEKCRKPLADSLTGVLDRHEWDRRAREAVAAAESRRRSVALILVDLDSFKTVNDTYGHLAGDAVLRAVAGVLGDIEGGTVGRYGSHAGDEFLVLLPGATADEAAAAARRAQDAVRRLAVPARASRDTSVVIDGQTVSMGVAAEVAGPTRPDLLADLLLDADVGLRAAKRSGGDMVCGADAGSAAPGTGADAGSTAADGAAAGVALPRPRVPRARRSGEPRRADLRSSAAGRGHDGEVRIPLASFGQDAGGGPEELVLSSAAAEHLHRVLGEALGRRPSAPLSAP